MVTNVHFKLLPLIFLKKLIMLLRFYINKPGCLGISVSCSKAYLSYLSRKKIVFVNFFETALGIDILSSFNDFQCNDTGDVKILF